MKAGCKWIALVGVLVATSEVPAAEHIVLNEDNWSQFAPAGKEADCIYGDHVLVSDRLVAVVAHPSDRRNANLTVKEVSGCVIDLTHRDQQNDQLSCFYPHKGTYKLQGPVDWPSGMPVEQESARLAFAAVASDAASDAAPPYSIQVGYELTDGQEYLTIRSLVTNLTDTHQTLQLCDGVRADGEFTFGKNKALGLWWCQDSHWQQAYGVTSPAAQWQVQEPKGKKRKLRQVCYSKSETDSVTIAPQESLLLERRLYVASDTLSLLKQVALDDRVETDAFDIRVSDATGPLADANVKAIRNEKVIGSGRTDKSGHLRTSLPTGNYLWVVEANGREHRSKAGQTEAGQTAVLDVVLPQLGTVVGQITDDSGTPIPCRIGFFGQGVANPNFGPDSAVHGVRNLWHTPNGAFQVDLLPGIYELVISYGPEYDALVETVEVVAGQQATIAGQLKHSVDTSGWISAELHSHSSPSGDNTSSQKGRVLNLLVEQLEFIPCTEHQRISSYQEHLVEFDAVNRVLTCSGMELTGQPLPLNHQNVFPLKMHDHTQDGGGPEIDVDPEVQIERIALWDDRSDKVVQINHPNIAQMIGDRDLDGTPDQGFRRMFHFADIMEVHPLSKVFQELELGGEARKDRGNAVMNWIQMLNLGYRLPGVVNTDAHWNYYGSGWLRNYVRAKTDVPSELELMDVCHALEDGQIVMTNGPFMEVEVSSGDKTVGPGDDLQATDQQVNVHVRVQCPNWLDVNRVQLFLNGRPDLKYNFTRTDDPARFGDGVVKFDQNIELPVSVDTHVVVVAAAEGRQLGRVYGEQQGKQMPIAVANPVFIDTDGNGFQANGDDLGLPLPVKSDHVPTHGHDHHHHHH
ncbi:CehA/McbA family metallohydrolase [Aeoliella sp. ICT_H6.2]|uniref:CehA/McbA family metallohydrolase n=1 Tax=Aeoliella straminimaris TaxID=2954799 RepID=A0A9X2FD08_9BACT|nr:CehA/McbA family metallohydrolase [Aeoliella straminimaris]MCO6045963.1 CehA/McbA family metallohydrolase [Aeoliella straminimaris]